MKTTKGTKTWAILFALSMFVAIAVPAAQAVTIGDGCSIRNCKGECCPNTESLGECWIKAGHECSVEMCWYGVSVGAADPRSCQMMQMMG